MTPEVTRPAAETQGDMLTSRSPVVELYRTRTKLVLTLALLLGLALIAGASALSHQHFLNTLLNTVGFTLIATALFTILQTVAFTSSVEDIISAVLRRDLSSHHELHSETLAAIRSQLTSTLVELRSEITRVLHDDASRYRPTHDFHPTNSPDAAFNDALQLDLASSEVYRFRGLAGAYTAFRIGNTEHQLRKLVAVLPDPREDEALRTRVRQELVRDAQQGTDLAWSAALNKQRHSMALAIVGLYSYRYRLDIEIHFTPRAYSNRIEVFDSAAYLTLFTDISSAVMKFPRTLRFDSHSLMYEVLRSEFEADVVSQRAHSYTITMTTDYGQLDLMKDVTALGLCEDAETDWLADRLAEFQSFGVHFKAELGVDILPEA